MIDLNKIHNVYFVGIKGVALTALAIVCFEMGKQISGSDTAEDFPTKQILDKYKFNYFTGFNQNHINKTVDLVIYTGAHGGSSNPEVIQAKNLGIPTISHGQALGLFMQDHCGISVAGAHGKTTVAAMLAHALVKLDQDPTYAIGCGSINSLNTPAHFGKGKYFIAEADEYITDPNNDQTPRFLWQHPQIEIITNIDFDHPDAYQNIDDVKDAFNKFTQNINSNGCLIYNSDNQNTVDVANRYSGKKISYGVGNANYQLIKYEILNSSNRYTIKTPEGKYTGELVIIGKHNALNAISVICTLVHCGFSINKVIDALTSFTGTKRRLELISQNSQRMFFDDYAHHPRQIIVTLDAIKTQYPNKKIIVIFQPHTFSRTKVLFNDFVSSFSKADIVIVTDIYSSARETYDTSISAKMLYTQIKLIKQQTFYAPNKDDVLAVLKSLDINNKIIITLGAGNIYNWVPDIEKNI